MPKSHRDNHKLVTLCIALSIIIASVFFITSRSVTHITTSSLSINDLSRQDSEFITGYNLNLHPNMSQLLLAQLSDCINLESLDLSGHKLSQHDYEWISDLRNLKSLKLSNTQLDDKCFGHLARLTNIETLILDGCKIGDSSLPIISSMTKLKSLTIDLTGSNENKLLLDNLRYLNQLQELSIVIDGNDTEIDAVSRCSNLQKLEINAAKLSNFGFHAITSISTLRELSVQVSNQESTISLSKPNARCKQLSKLRLCNLKLDSGILSTFIECNSLKEIDIDNAGIISDNDVSVISNKGIRQLCFQDTLLGPNVVKIIGSIPTITALSFINCRTITDNDIQLLSMAKSLQYLSLSGCSHISDESMRSITKMRNIKRLDISQTSITSGSLNLLLAMVNLEELVICGTKLELHVRQLESLLPKVRVTITSHHIEIVEIVLENGDKIKDTIIHEPFGETDGTVTAKGRTWIQLLSDRNQSRCYYTPIWHEKSNGNKEGYDLRVLRFIHSSKVGDRIHFKWRYDLRPRIITINNL